MQYEIKRGLVAFALSALAAACGNKRSGSSAGIPLVEPPVTKATPSGLSSTLMEAQSVPDFHLFTLNISEVKTRFFSSGPTQISALLKSIDSRLSEINTRSAESTRACLSATAVEDIATVFGAATAAKFQCYDTFSDNSGGMLFGKADDTWYLYTNVGQGRSLAKVSPVSGSSGEYVVDAWLSVGQGNATSSSCSSSWYGCSYGVMRLQANSATKSFEMTAAGTGMGYCGVHLKSDGTNLYVKGSAGGYSGSSWSCAAADELCGLASAPGTAGTCTSINQSSFALTTLGVTGQSTFGTGITLNGTSTDSVHFGRNVDQLSTLTGVAAF